MTTMSQPMSVLTSQSTTEWYTPPWIIERVRATLGGIDLDPATSAYPQTWIKATRYHTLQLTAEDTALLAACDPRSRGTLLRRISRAQLAAQPAWQGRVFCNPPFDDTPAWVNRAGHDYQDRPMTGMLLVNSAPGYGWWERLWNEYPVVMLEKRLRFINAATGEPGAEAKKGSALAYLGRDLRRFASVWGDVGRVLIPAGAMR